MMSSKSALAVPPPALVYSTDPMRSPTAQPELPAACCSERSRLAQNLFTEMLAFFMRQDFKTERHDAGDAIDVVSEKGFVREEGLRRSYEHWAPKAAYLTRALLERIPCRGCL